MKIMGLEIPNRFAQDLAPSAVVVLLLFLTFRYSYAFFHTTIEMFSVIVAYSIFIFAWNTRKISRNNYFLFLGIAFFFVGGLDFVHALAYEGINLFAGFDTNLPTQLWIAARYLLAASILVSPIMINKKFNILTIFIAYVLIVLLIGGSIFAWKIFPTSYIEGKGLTQFKIISEYMISLLFLASIIILTHFKSKFDRNVFLLLLAALFVNIIAELFFTLYVSVSDAFNMLGHFAKLFSYYLVYIAIIETGLRKPYNLLFLELEEAGKRKDEFLSIVSHEIKNPLTNIKIYSQLLRRQLLKDRDTKRVAYADHINQQADKITGLINDLLDVRRIESGRLKFNSTKFNFDNLVEQIVADFKHLPSQHRIVLRGRVGIRVNGDANRIGQVLINLITNAIKYSPPGSDIIIQLGKEKDRIVTSVQDFGIGISKNKLNRVFDKYYQTEPGQKSAQGIGLGLYIAKEIIHRHHGKIWAESEKGKGSTFYFALPKTKSRK